jgi:RNA polymerase primary sigma factor
MAKHFRQNKTAAGITTSTKESIPGEGATVGRAHADADANRQPRRERRSRGEDEADSDINDADKKTGFISAGDVAAKRAAHLLQEMEPTSEEMASEKLLMDNGLPKARKGKRQLPEAGKDLLASYMEQLSHIPLFTPEQEMDAAKELERTELATWHFILQAPKAVAYLREECANLEPELRNDVDNLEQSYRKAAARTYKKKLDATPSRADIIERMARALRYEDFDKELLERVIGRMRREVWGRRVLSNNSAYRLTHADMTEVERSRGAALRTRNNFVRANLRLVISVARNFHHFRIPFIDLVQEGNVGLMKAVHRFDHRRGFRFSTYAHWWIRQSIERAIINKGSQVRLPVHVIDSRRQVNRASTKLHHAFGRAPNAEEIAQAMGLPTDKVEQVLSGVQQDPVSLDESISGADPRKFLDLVRDENIPAVDEALIRENTHEHVRELLHMLNPVEKDIIRRRFGLGADTDETLDEIGKIYNLSRERVRQIQAQGLMKMRRMCERRRIG